MLKQHRNWYLKAGSRDFNDKDMSVALLILNNPCVMESADLLDVVWGHSDFKVCADGGANILYQMHSAKDADNGISESTFLPDLIKGDLDSLISGIGSYYKSRGVQVVLENDQNSNDLDKCMESLIDYHTDRGKVSSCFGRTNQMNTPTIP